jgi:3beta-hydroxy-delta5-steroid dehydrogenase/steroid delta-isomerase
MLVIVIGAMVVIAGAVAYLVMPPKARTVRKPSATADPNARPGLAKSVAKDAPSTGKRYVVVGTGNVGMTLVEALIERGETNVVGFDISMPRRTPAKHFAYVKGDVTDYEQVRQALIGADVVYATFAVIKYQERLPHDYAFSHKVNVTGTENVIRACVANGVQLLLQTSTSHVVMSPSVHDRMDLDESAAYCTADTAENHYAWTKAQSEQLILAANGTPLPSGGKLLTVALRPCSGIFGAMDQMISELTLKNFKTKSAEMVTATGTIDWIYVEDLVYAELLAERKLLDSPETVGAQTRARRAA